ncbi:MAG TPA: HAMP domain-containing sensor histidine kinase [Deltaproteobacteria bacterium]|nr:HAMP domain-containing sensor histidine kinase [Deltaproteobacteria bacterium]
MRKPGLLQKLILSYVIFVIVLAGITLVLFMVSSRVSTLSTRIYLVDYKKKEITDKLIANLISIEETGKQYMLLQNDSYRVILEQQEADIAQAWENLSARGMYYDEPERNMVENGKGLWMAYVSRFHSQLRELPGRPEALEQVFDRNSREIDGVVAVARYINREAIDRLRNHIAYLKDLGDEIMAWTWWALAVGLSIGLIVPVLIYMSVTRDLKRIRGGIRHVAEGDFAYRINLESTDELGMLAEAFNNMALRLKELDDMKSEFVSVVSHELKTPLTSMKEAASLLLEGLAGALTDKQRRLVEIMAQGIRRLLNTVSELLDMSRIEGGLVVLNREAHDMNAVVSSFISEIKPVADAGNIGIAVKYAPESCMVMVDRNKILQVLTNLTHNAIKYSPEGAMVEIRVRNTDGNIITEVEDHGKGIPEEDLPRIFEKFYQARYTRGHGGIGLGLAISRGIVDAHGGKMYAHSQVGQGSVFAFHLPCAHGHGALPGVCEGPALDEDQRR